LNQQTIEIAFLKLSKQRKLDFSLYLFEAIPSTNQILWDLLDQGLKLPLVAIASQQTAGRGQWGRQWQSPLGGLYLSLALETNIPAQNAPHLTLLSAWGIATALGNCEIPVWLKWPNDLILENRKLGGIKSEIRIHQKTITQAVIGVGINWINPVPETGINLQSWTQTSQRSPISSLEMLAATVLQGLFLAYQCYLTSGIDPILSDYLTIFHNLGQTVTIAGSPGIIVGVNPTGDLRVRLQSPGATTEISVAPGSISLGLQGTNKLC
jgi:BirA family biotin operon repressor/biotin-[acetyl-CoA-carboxylase] ligase